MARIVLYFLLSLTVVVFTGCSASVSDHFVWQDDDVDLVWPEPPDQARIRYLRSLTGPGDFKSEGRTSGMLSWFLGETQYAPSLLNPFSVAASQSGSVWVADSGSKLLYRLDLTARKVDYFQEISGLGLLSPIGVAVDNQRQRVYLSDSGHRRVFVLDLEGRYLDSWAPAEGFERPAGLAVASDGRLFVADAMGGVVYVFNAEGSVVSRVWSKVAQNGRFRRPLNVALGPMGEVLVLDALSFQVEVQNAQGELLGTIGQLGDAAGFMARPKGLAVDQNGYVFVSDSAFDNVQVFDMAGNLLMYWGEAGRKPGDFNLPAGLFIDHEKRLFVADSYNKRVQVFQLLY